MIEWLTKLPKLIDAFIAGVIEFCYQFLGSVLRVSRSPLKGSRALQANEDRLSSKTMLFGAVSIFNLSAFIDVSNTLSLAGNRLGYFMVMAIGVYMFFDGLAALGALYCAKRPGREQEDDVRRLLRYGLAASLVVQALAIPVMRFGHIEGQFDLASAIKFAIIVCAGFYQPVFIFYALAGIGKTRVARVLVTLIATPVFGFAITALLQGFGATFARLEGSVGGSIHASPGQCSISPEGVRTVIGIDNASAEVAYLTHRTLRLRIDYGKERFDLPISSIEGDLKIVASRNQAVVIAHTTPDSAALDRLRELAGKGICQLAIGTTGRSFVLESSAPLETAVLPLKTP